jgi:hypothetical protein
MWTFARSDSRPAASDRGFVRRLGFIAVTLLLLAPAACTRAGAERPRMLWGIGDQLGAAQSTPFYRDGLANMVTTWFNGAGDLDWMKGYANGTAVSDLYGSGKAIELVVWLADDPGYAISDKFQADLRTLIGLYRGTGPHYGPLYVVLFTEFETYQDGDEAYRAKLMAAYLAAVKVVHAEYNEARVGLGFGGYAWDGSGERDLARYTAQIEASDFVATQHMQACDTEVNGRNVIIDKVRSSVRQLGSYGKPVMISHFKLWGSPSCQVTAFKKLSREVFTGPSLAQLAADGLFAWDFMSDHYINDAGSVYADFRGRIAPYVAALPPSPLLPSAGLP